MLRKLKDLVIRDRQFKVGDVFRWIPMYGQEVAESRGFGVVIDVDGPIFKAYWTGDERIREHDSRLVHTSFILQDYAPMPEVAEVLRGNQ